MGDIPSSATVTGLKERTLVWVEAILILHYVFFLLNSREGDSFLAGKRYKTDYRSMFLAVGRVNSESSKLTNGDRQKEVIIATEGAVQSGGTWWGVDMSRKGGA